MEYLFSIVEQSHIMYLNDDLKKEVNTLTAVEQSHIMYLNTGTTLDFKTSAS